MTRYRPRSSTIYSSIVMGLCGLIAIATLIGGGWYQARPAFGFLALIAAVAYTAYFRPSVDVYNDQVTLVNVVTIATVPYARLASIDTKWALQLHADDGSKATAFAAPAPGAMRARHLKAWNPAESGVATLIYSTGPGTSLESASGAAAHLVDNAHRAWLQKSTAQPATATPAEASASASASGVTTPETATASGKAISRRPHWLSIAALFASVVLLVLSF